MHHRSIGGQEKAIAKALRKYSPDEICRAIERYSCVRENKSGKYRDVYAWTLGEFLTRKDHYNIERFNAESWEDPFVSQDHRRADAGLPADDPGSDPIWDLVDGKAVMRLPR